MGQYTGVSYIPQPTPMSCWWASFRMLSRAYHRERSAPEHWDPRFRSDSSNHAPYAPLAGARQSPSQSVLRSYYDWTYARGPRSWPPHLWMERGLPPDSRAIHVLCGLMRGAIRPVSFARDQFRDASQTVDLLTALDELLRANGPLMTFARFPQSGELVPGLGQRFLHVVLMIGVFPSMRTLFFLDPAIPRSRQPRVQMVSRPLRTPEQVQQHQPVDDFGSVFGTYPFLGWNLPGSGPSWQPG